MPPLRYRKVLILGQNLPGPPVPGGEVRGVLRAHGGEHLQQDGGGGQGRVPAPAGGHGRAGRVQHPAPLLHHRHPRLRPGVLSDLPAEVSDVPKLSPTPQDPLEVGSPPPKGRGRASGSPDSFQVVQTLHSKLHESRGKTRMPVVLVGNKADLSLQSREVRTDEGKKLAESWGAIFLESSAMENQVTQGIFTKIIEEIDRVDNSYSRSTGCCLM